MVENEEDDNEPTYVEVVAEARWNVTEKRETIEDILNRIVEGDVFLDDRFDGRYLVVRNSSMDALQLLGDWIREQQQIDTVRERLFRSTVNNLTALYFNRQAAAMGRIALVDINDEPPNGPVIFQLVSDGLNHVINKLTPRTYRGRIVSDEEWAEIQERKRKRREKKKHNWN